MLICIPAQDGHDWTQKTVDSIMSTARSASTEVLIFDNASETSYGVWGAGESVSVLRSEQNIGFYAPLNIARGRGHDIVALCHNDLLFYEEGWDVRMEAAFADDLKLGIIGLCGSDELDEMGGRGGGTMCFFRGEQGQSQAAGLRIHDLRPAIVLDSLFMAFRSRMVPWIERDWSNLPLAHFYDKIWPCRAYEQGWRTAVLGVECDHAGGITIVANNRYTEDCKRWFDERPDFAIHISTEAHQADGTINYEMAMYKEAEQRFLSEYRDKKKLMPCRIDSNYVVKK